MNAPDMRPVPGFPDYAVSAAGEIFRVVPDSRNHRLTGRPLVAAPNHGGYLELTLCRDGKHCQARVNRIVCAAFHGPAPSSMHHAAHIDGNRANNRADNLAWKLPVENEADKVAHGTALRGDKHPSRIDPSRLRRGEKHGRSKLNPDAVRAIRTDTRKQRDIARDFGVSQRAVWMVKRRITWGHVE